MDGSQRRVEALRLPHQPPPVRSGGCPLHQRRTSAEPPTKPGPLLHPLANRRRRERPQRPTHERRVGSRPARPVRSSRRRLLLQAMGRPHSQGRRTRPRRHPSRCTPERSRSCCLMTSQVKGEVPLLSGAELDALATGSSPIRPIREAKDHLVGVREYHGWTLNKLNVLRNYLKMYRQVAGGGTFIDAFAGTGSGVSFLYGQDRPSDGSSVIAAQSGAFSNLHLIEYDSNSVETLAAAIRALPTRQSRNVTIHAEDCNRIIPELLSNQELDALRPCFALLDQDELRRGRRDGSDRPRSRCGYSTGVLYIPIC